MHKVLKRLLLKTLPDQYDSLAESDFIGKVNEIFKQYDEERLMLERSLMLSSEELNEINSLLKTELTNKKNYQNQLESTLIEQDSIINSVPEAILNFQSDGTLKQVNSVGFKFLNITKEELANLGSYRGLKLIIKKIVRPQRFISTIRHIRTDNSIEIKGYMNTTDGEYYEYYSVPSFFDGEYSGRVWCFKNITDIKKNEQKLQFQAYHDELTHLPNRTLLKESIDQVITDIGHSNEQVALLFIDLDDFKKINDTLGHYQGDQFLIDISRRIKSTLGDRNMLGRMSGDEFLIILEGITHPNQIIRAHNKVLALFDQPFQICEHQYALSCSIGVSIFPQDGNQSEVLLRKADMAMYQAKVNGKNRVHYFDTQLEQLVISKVNIENEIRQAIKHNRFLFHYQPKMDLITHELLGVEALIRMETISGEILYPDAFIAVAEKSGLIRDITKAVIEQTCETLTQWQTMHLRNIPIAINVTAMDFTQYNFVTELLKSIHNAGAPSHLLQLEITESVLMDDIENVMQVINELKKHGISIAIDDFGTGYSSFSYLQELDVDYLKIDKSFIQNVNKTQKSQAIVKSIIDLGNNLGIKVIAEGVETIKDHNFLCANNCRIGQGYYYNRPLTISQLFNYTLALEVQTTN